jgi:hypothetical protein
MKRSRTILVALDVVPTTESMIAQRLIEVALNGSPLLNPTSPHAIVESWHIAEDDRIDANDSQSAVFCRTGCQAEARDLLEAHGLA